MQVEIELNIPAFDLVPHQRQLRCAARVIRVEACYQLRGFAVAGRIEGDHFEDNEDDKDKELQEEQEKKEKGQPHERLECVLRPERRDGWRE